MQKHIAILERAGLVTKRRIGRRKVVRTNPAGLAIAAGGRLVSDANAPSWWTLADAEGNEVDVATTLSRD